MKPIRTLFVMATGGVIVYFLDPEQGPRRRATAQRRLGRLLRRGSDVAQDQGMSEVANALDKAEAVTRRRSGRSNGSIIVGGQEAGETPIIVTPSRATTVTR